MISSCRSRKESSNVTIHTGERFLFPFARPAKGGLNDSSGQRTSPPVTTQTGSPKPPSAMALVPGNFRVEAGEIQPWLAPPSPAGQASSALLWYLGRHRGVSLRHRPSPLGSTVFDHGQELWTRPIIAEAKSPWSRRFACFPVSSKPRYPPSIPMYSSHPLFTTPGGQYGRSWNFGGKRLVG